MNNGKIVLGVVTGAVIVGAVGLLIASEKGADIRKKIMDMVGDFASDLKDKFSDSMKIVTDKVEDVKDDAKEVFEKGKSKMEEGYNKFKDLDHHDKVLPDIDIKL